MMLEHKIYNRRTRTYMGGPYRESTQFVLDLLRRVLDAKTVNVIEIRTYHTMRGEPELVASRKTKWTEDNKVIIACDEEERHGI